MYEQVPEPIAPVCFTFSYQQSIMERLMQKKFKEIANVSLVFICANMTIYGTFINLNIQN